jgi:alkanesulfonate monooxygenase SsuD/methylene tetrahydromethanopterin reductase-like flavin-dependent oxidoreductase (luciferase family)
MHYGFYLPTRGQTATPEALETLVQRAEAFGLHSVMIADHVVFPVASTSKYPYTVSGAFPGHRPFSGTTAQIAEDIATYAKLGVSELIFDFRSETLHESLDRMEHFATVIRPATAA